MERIGFMAKDIETGIIYDYTIDENDNFYIKYGNDNWVREDIDDFEILEIFYSVSN